MAKSITFYVYSSKQSRKMQACLVKTQAVAAAPEIYRVLNLADVMTIGTCSPQLKYPWRPLTTNCYTKIYSTLLIFRNTKPADF